MEERLLLHQARRDPATLGEGVARADLEQRLRGGAGLSFGHLPQLPPPDLVEELSGFDPLENQTAFELAIHGSIIARQACPIEE